MKREIYEMVIKSGKLLTRHIPLEIWQQLYRQSSRADELNEQHHSSRGYLP